MELDAGGIATSAKSFPNLFSTGELNTPPKNGTTTKKYESDFDSLFPFTTAVTPVGAKGTSKTPNRKTRIIRRKSTKKQKKDQPVVVNVIQKE